MVILVFRTFNRGIVMQEHADADMKKEEREQVVELGSDLTKFQILRFLMVPH